MQKKNNKKKTGMRNNQNCHVILLLNIYVLIQGPFKSNMNRQ